MNIIILYLCKIFFFGHDYSLDFFHFILNPGQRRVFQLVVNKTKIYIRVA
jgi:hypothetical protein